MWINAQKSIFNSQPNENISIDYSNPLAQGLQFLAMPTNSVRVLYDYCTNKFFLPAGALTAHSLKTDANGRAVGQEDYSNVETGYLTTTPGNQSRSQLAVLMGPGGGNRTPALCADYGGYVGFVGANAGFAYSGSSITTSMSLANIPFRIASRCRNSNWAFAINGVIKTTENTGNYYDALGSTSAVLRIAGIPAGFASTLHRVYLAASWNRWLSNRELELISGNPWQLFKRTNRFVSLGVKPRTPMILVRKSRQPNESASIDYSNPLCKDLVSVVVPTARCDFVTGAPLSALPITVTQEGLGLYPNGTVPQISNPHVTALAYTSDVTIAVYSKRPTSSYSGMQFVRGGSGDYNGWGFGYVGSYDQLGFQMNYGSAGMRRGGDVIGERPQLGQIFTAAVTKVAGASSADADCKLYMKGKKISSATGAQDGSGSPFTPATNTLQFGRDALNTVGGTYPILLCAIAKRIWSAAEVASFNDDPWQIFKPKIRNLYNTQPNQQRVKIVGAATEINTQITGNQDVNFGSITGTTVDNYVLVLAKSANSSSSITDILVDGVSGSLSGEYTIYGHKIRWGLVKLSSGGTKSLRVVYSGIPGATNVGVVAFELKGYKLGFVTANYATGTPSNLTLSTLANNSALFSWAIGNTVDPLLEGNATFTYLNTTDTYTYEAMMYTENAGQSGQRYFPWKNNRDVFAIEVGFTESQTLSKTITEILSISELFTPGLSGVRRIFIS